MLRGIFSSPRKRVVFEGSKRSMDLNLANTGQDTATYSISIVQIRMKEDGGFETITEPDPGQLFADKNIRYFPRSVILGPNEAQVVKVQVTRTNELSPGEYRSHFYFRAVPKAKPLGEKEDSKRHYCNIGSSDSCFWNYNPCNDKNRRINIKGITL